MAFVIIAAGLCILAPLAWRKVQDAALPKRLARPHGISRPDRPAAEKYVPKVAPLRPLVAEQIDLDPSVTETPPLPSRSPADGEKTLGDPNSQLRFSSRQPLALEPRIEELPIRYADEPLSLEPELSLEPDFPATRAWPYPSGLVEQLNILAATTPLAAAWTEQAKAEIDRLVAAPSLADPAVGGPLAGLERLAGEGKRLAESIDDTEARSSVLRAGYAIVRRLVIWDMVHELARRERTHTALPQLHHGQWNAALGRVDAMLAPAVAANWRQYLLIDRARAEFDSSSVTLQQQRELAREILHRLHSTQLSHEQEQFLQLPPFAALAEQLKVRAAEPPDLTGLLAAIERHEHVDRSTYARELALEYEALRWSNDPAVQELAETVNAYYRNANVRVALSDAFLNRMIPARQPQVEPVQDTIQGAWVEGQSHTRTRLRMFLLPDRRRWNIGLEASGEVATNTLSSKGPATFYQDGWSLFRARKRVIVDRRGIRLYSAEATANADNHLNEFETDFDGIPLLGSIARSIALSQYDETQPAAKIEVEGKIVDRATSQLDREVAQQLEKGKGEFQVKLIDPLRKLDLEPTAVDLETTAERLIARYRLAARNQLGAATPRPQAPGDSVLSVQVHESAFNNILEQLGLAGRRVKLDVLYAEMVERFSQEPVEIPEDLPEDVYVTFAEEDPVRIDAQDGRLRLTIRLRELSQGDDYRWNHFTVRGYYAPSADQLDANLQREGIIELIGDRGTIRLRDQIALRGIFSKVLSRNRKLNLVNKQIAQAPELTDHQVTQFVVHDGWIGVAVGPQTPGRQAYLQPRPQIDDEAE